MKKMMWVLLPVFAAFSFRVFAVTSGNVGMVDMQRIILTVEDGKKARNDLEKVIKEKEKQFKAEKEELDKLNREWKTQGALLSEEARMRKQQEFQEKFMGLRNAEMQFQNEIKQQEAKATQEIAVKVSQVVSVLAKEKSLDLVFETSSSGLMYAKSPVDLTSEVIAQYDKPEKPVKTAQAKTGKTPTKK